VTIALRDLQPCFEGVIPSVISTTAADGTPNISYLSHVVAADEANVALSNQFFAKTAANVRANPSAAVLLVDPRNGMQYCLKVTWDRSLDDGPLFDQVAEQLRASSAQVGMSGVMRLKAVDIFRVDSIEAVASAIEQDSLMGAPEVPGMLALAAVTERIGDQSETEGVIEALLSGVCGELRFEHAIVLLGDGTRDLLTTIASLGYERSGVGSEVPLDEGLIGTAAAAMRTVKVNDMSRIRRFGAAIEASSSDENRTKTIALPGLPDALSQIAVPLVAQGKVRGVLFVESRERLAFSQAHALALEMIAAQAATALALCEVAASEPPEDDQAPTPAPRPGKAINVTHHRFDDSVFIDNVYVIKGVAGRLLMFMLEAYLGEGRHEFTNREMRLSESLRLPEIKDNLETRLLLLRRRLDEKALGVRLIHVARGQVKLEIEGSPKVERSG
jgi:adenylate cyclase